MCIEKDGEIQWVTGILGRWIKQWVTGILRRWINKWVTGILRR